MHRQKVEFTVIRKDGVISKIGRSAMFQRKPIRRGGTEGQHQDRPGQKKG